MVDSSMPLIDLHRHLDGSVRLSTILELGRQHNLPLPAWTLEELRPHVQVTESPSGPATMPGVMAFIAKFRWMTEILVDYDACRRIAYENVEDADAEGIDYVELRFSPYFMAETHGLDPAGVVEAVVDGVQAAARDLPIRANLIGIISRTYGPDAGYRELEALLSQHDHLVGLDLAGDEANWPGDLFVEHFRRADAVGLKATIHAGEAAGPQSIWQAVQELGASRIGHAVSAAQDDRLLDYLAGRGIGIEVNLTSNVQTRTVPDYASHPAKRFLQKGLLVTLNTDDPGISAIDLRHEYSTAAPAAGFSAEEIRQTQRNALTVAFLSQEDKSALLQERTTRPTGRGSLNA